MTVRMNGTVRHCLAGSAFCGLIVVAVAPAMSQWLPPPWVATRGDIRQSLEAQGYVLIAPLQRRPYVYLADVSAGPAGYQRLVIDARSGEILQRFVPPPRRWGTQLAERGGLLAGPPPYGFAEPGPGGGFSTLPDGRPAAKSAYGGPTGVRIPAAISPVGSPDALPATKPKSPKSQSDGAAAAAAAVPLPPPKPTDSDKPKADSSPTEVESAPPAAPEGANEDASKASVGAPPVLKPEAAPKTEPSATVQSEATPPQPNASRRSGGPALQPTVRDSSAEPSEKSKVSIVPATLFE